jgi:mRNA-degrading endonuclease RelE of RelBE toxin-antitoxin system
VPTEVVATPRAEQQIDGLDRRQSKSFNDFLDNLAARGCRALAYRLSGPTPLDQMCTKHLSSSLRVVVAFESPHRAWILLVGPHDDDDQIMDVYAELYRLLGMDPPDAAGRLKPPCCDDAQDQPPVLGGSLTEILDRATKIRKTRRSS